MLQDKGKRYDMQLQLQRLRVVSCRVVTHGSLLI